MSELPEHQTSIVSLPQELLGHVYSFLPNKESKKAFYSSTSAVCTAPSILQQIFKLHINLEDAQLSWHADDPSSNPLLTYPRKARLRTLEIECSPEIECSLIDGDEPLNLMLMLFPEAEEHRRRVTAVMQDVEELSIEHCWLYRDEECVRLGEFFAHECHSLRSIKMLYGTFLPSFFQALSAAGDITRKIKHLEMDQAGEEHDEALRSFECLESLRYSAADDRPPRIPIDVISELHQLKGLCLDFLPAVDAVASLPSALETLGLETLGLERGRIDALTTVVTAATSGVLPALKEISIPLFAMTLSTHSGDIDADGALTQSFAQLSQCLSPAPANLILVVDSLFYDCVCGTVHPIFWAVCSALGPFTKKISFRSPGTNVPDAEKIKNLCPSLKGLHLQTNSKVMRATPFQL